MSSTHAAIAACRSEIAAQVQACRDLVGAASKASGMSLVSTRDAALPHDADASVLRVDFGERVALNADDVETLAAAFLAELERKVAGRGPRRGAD